MKRIFISLPYTSADPEIVGYRVAVAENYFIKLLAEGYCPLSPVVIGHGLVSKYGVNASFEYWDMYCETEILTCDEIHVIMLTGWELSVGIEKEIEIAKHNKKVIKYINVELNGKVINFISEGEIV